MILPSGVSGGQKKRVTIAEASLSRPVISFYDGYTKGLDSATALGLAQGLSAVCWNSQGGRTVVASQYVVPSSCANGSVYVNIPLYGSYIA